LIDIEILKHMNYSPKIALTKHAKERLTERNISIADIINGIETGEIIKQYEEDKPLPSCLILGTSVKRRPLHIVISHDKEFIYLITAYYPDPEKWDKNFKTRKDH